MTQDLSIVVPQLLAQGLLALRQQAIMPRLVNRRYEAMAGERGSTITIPIPSAITASTVAPAAYAPAGVDLAPTSATIALSQWKEAPFTLTDKELLEVQEGTIPMQASEAIKAIANTVDTYIFNQCYNVFNTGGTAGTTPFASDLAAYQAARKKMNDEAAPVDDRTVVLGSAAESNALFLALFQQANQRGDQGGVIRGEIGDKIGAKWVMDQNVPTHTAGAWAGTPLTNGALAVGASSVVVDGLTASTTIKQGDIITFAGDTQEYAVTSADTTASGLGAATVTVYPKIRTAVADNTAITAKASHVMNLMFHRDAIAFATRPLVSLANQGLGVISQSAVDPVSGLTLRLEVQRGFKQLRWSFDILYGAACVRPELAARILG